MDENRMVRGFRSACCGSTYPVAGTLFGGELFVAAVLAATHVRTGLFFIGIVGIAAVGAAGDLLELFVVELRKRFAVEVSGAGGFFGFFFHRGKGLR